MRSYYTLSIWILLGTFAGYGFLTLVGLGDKNEYSSRAFNFEKSASSVVNIWSLRRWREWQEKTPSLGLRRWKQVIKFKSMSSIKISKCSGIIKFDNEIAFFNDEASI